MAMKQRNDPRRPVTNPGRELSVSEQTWKDRPVALTPGDLHLEKGWGK